MIDDVKAHYRLTSIEGVRPKGTQRPSAEEMEVLRQHLEDAGIPRGKNGRPAMSVDDWAREQARDRYEIRYSAALGASAVRNAREQAFEKGIVHAFDALLSDEAVEAAAELFYTIQTGTVGKYHTSTYKETWDASARAALQAAIDAVTKEARP